MTTIAEQRCISQLHTSPATGETIAVASETRQAAATLPEATHRFNTKGGVTAPYVVGHQRRRTIERCPAGACRALPEALPASQVLDVWLHRLGMADAHAVLDGFVRCGRPHLVATVNMDFLRLARADLGYRDILNGADLAVADGMPVVWLARLHGTPLPERVAGIDLVEQAAALAATQGYSVFLLGAEPGVAHEAAGVLVKRYPGLQIAGTYAPPVGPFSVAEEERIVALVRAAQTQMLFVAFGAPRQETWIHRHLIDIDVPVCIGVGGSFNFLAGRCGRAPQWMQRRGLEWAYRLRQDPRRLWRRYLIEDMPLFLSAAAARLLPA